MIGYGVEEVVGWEYGLAGSGGFEEGVVEVGGVGWFIAVCYSNP